jgi:hypothetical protein
MNASTIDPESIDKRVSRGKHILGFAFWKKKDPPKRKGVGDSSKKRPCLSKLKWFCWKRVGKKGTEERSHSIACNNHSLLQAPTQNNSTELVEHEDLILQEVGSTDVENEVLTPEGKENMVSGKNSPTSIVDWSLEMCDDNDDFVPESLGKLFEEAGMQLEEEKEGTLHPENEKPSVAAGTPQYAKTVAAGACVVLLSDKDIERNRTGFEYLNALTQPSTSSINHDEAKAIANSLIYGGEPKSVENLLRYHFASFFCDFQEREEDNYDYDEDDDDVDDEPWGLHRGALHLEAIKILINSLQIILDEADNSRYPIVDFSSQFWARVFDTLVHNVQESSEDLEFTRFSVKCLRVLHGLNPPVVDPLVKYSLFPFLLNANECGCSMLEEECKQLLEAFAENLTD